jgi:hypothetical protein
MGALLPSFLVNVPTSCFSSSLLLLCSSVITIVCSGVEHKLVILVLSHPVSRFPYPFLPSVAVCFWFRLHSVTSSDKLESSGKYRKINHGHFLPNLSLFITHNDSRHEFSRPATIYNLYR